MKDPRFSHDFVLIWRCLLCLGCLECLEVVGMCVFDPAIAAFFS